MINNADAKALAAYRQVTAHPPLYDVPSPLKVREAQHAPEHIGSGYAISEVVYTTSS